MCEYNETVLIFKQRIYTTTNINILASEVEFFKNLTVTLNAMVTFWWGSIANISEEVLLIMLMSAITLATNERPFNV